MDQYPLLDLRTALQECDEALDDLLWRLETLRLDGATPTSPHVRTALANVMALREHIGWVFPPALQQAIADEARQMEADANQWEPSTY